jgi:uncharacterized protein (TIGR03437 family)
VFSQGFQGLQGDARTGDVFGYAMVAGNFGGDLASDLLIGTPGEDGGGWGSVQRVLGNQKPTINAVVSGGLGLPSITTLSPNTLATAFGVGLFAPGLVRNVGPGDLSGGGLPRILDDTCLLINGRRAPLVFMRSDQFNFQARSEDSGQLEIQIIRNCEGFYPLESNVFSVAAAPVSPDIFAYDVAEDGSKTVAAINATTGKRVGPRDLGPEFEPALPGEIVLIYLTGLGLTNPSFAPGQLPPNDPSGAAPASSATVLIDGIEAEVQYAGTAPGFAGLYQINLMIPDTPNVGEVSVLITSSGGGPAAETPSNGFIAVE